LDLDDRRRHQGDATMSDPLLLNKWAGAVLGAALVIFGGRTAMDIALHEPKMKKAGWDLPRPDPAAISKGGAPVAAAFDFAALAEGLKKVSDANVSAGQDGFKKCAACHTIAKGGENRVGPNLWGVLNRQKAAVANFAYSDAAKAKGGTWSYENFAQFLWDPRGYMPGNKMAFAGVKDKQELTDLMAYLRTQADTPPPLPQ
jgi:cytochrome c